MSVTTYQLDYHNINEEIVEGGLLPENIVKVLEVLEESSFEPFYKIEAVDGVLVLEFAVNSEDSYNEVMKIVEEVNQIVQIFSQADDFGGFHPRPEYFTSGGITRVG